uniref:Uncharacterized protein n=1 Tax=Cacopsylla melanoneura TaxID=428564 RepID=A0A8D8ULQ4_9HEMI
MSCNVSDHKATNTTIVRAHGATIDILIISSGHCWTLLTMLNDFTRELFFTMDAVIKSYVLLLDFTRHEYCAALYQVIGIVYIIWFRFVKSYLDILAIWFRFQKYNVIL